MDEMAKKLYQDTIAHLTFEHLKSIRYSLDLIEIDIWNIKFLIGKVEETKLYHTPV